MINVISTKKLNKFVLAAIVFSTSACTQDVEQQLAASENAVSQLSNNLKSELKKSLESGGPLEALTVCNVEAQNITANVAKDTEMQVGRTSLKIRNPLNSPDAWEQATLHEFEKQKQSNKELKGIQTYEVIENETGKWFRFMKAIPTSEVCLVCHGESIAPAVEEKLKQLYPDDLATSYRVGDIRGAFTVKIKM